MPASPPNTVLVLRSLLVVVAIALIAGCAGRTVATPSAPDESILAPAEQALEKARSAEAERFAPRAVDAARRRIATARDILFDAARGSRELNATEQDRVERLIAAAELDARSAFVQTQARAVQTKLAELQGQLGQGQSSQTQQGVSP